MRLFCELTLGVRSLPNHGLPLNWPRRGWLTWRPLNEIVGVLVWEAMSISSTQQWDELRAHARRQVVCHSVSWRMCKTPFPPFRLAHICSHADCAMQSRCAPSGETSTRFCVAPPPQAVRNTSSLISFSCRSLELRACPLTQVRTGNENG